ncbi:MAG: hypothetical protein ACK5JF_05280 [Oscillospiraceae bacterium]
MMLFSIIGVICVTIMVVAVLMFGEPEQKPAPEDTGSQPRRRR